MDTGIPLAAFSTSEAAVEASETDDEFLLSGTCTDDAVSSASVLPPVLSPSASGTAPAFRRIAAMSASRGSVRSQEVGTLYCFFRGVIPVGVSS